MELPLLFPAGFPGGRLLAGWSLLLRGLLLGRRLFLGRCPVCRSFRVVAAATTRERPIGLPRANSILQIARFGMQHHPALVGTQRGRVQRERRVGKEPREGLW